MKRNFMPVFVFALVGVVGCGGGSGGDKLAAGGPASDAGPGNDAGPTKDAAPAKNEVKPLGFKLSNIAEPPAPQELAGDLILSDKCEVDTDAGTIDCADADRYEYAMLPQNDADHTEVAVFISKNLSIDSGAEVTVVGSRPVMFLAFGAVSVKGTLRAVPSDYGAHEANGGGFGSPSAGTSAGAGPGGGGPGFAGVGASGGSFCGVGGGSDPGTVYGTSEIHPLIGGSSGGTGMNEYAGAGGGAIQIVGRDSIDVTQTGVITAGGGGGAFGGAVDFQPASAGGSGGAILLEAPQVRVAGKLAANGGGGGGAAINGQAGQNAQPNGSAALGGPPNGGNGSSTSASAGISGTSTGAGGGGAGRIRINTSSGSADLTLALISPAVATGCASEGALAKK